MTELLIRLFVKNHGNIKEIKVRESFGKFAGAVGIVSNFLLFTIKVIVGIAFGSVAVTADAINNLSDSGASLVSLFGFKMSGKPADSQHPYGHARMEYISGLVVSFIVLFLGLQMVGSSIEKIRFGSLLTFSYITIVALIISILIKLWQFLFYRNIARRISSTALVATSIDSRNDIISTSVVLAAYLISKLTGYDLDGYMGLIVAIFILISGIGLIRDTVSPLLGTAPSRELIEKIYEKILSYDGIIGLHDLAIHSYGESIIYASVHCEVPAENDIMLSHDIIDNIERDFTKDMGIHLVIHLDPVVTNDERTNSLKAQVEEIISTFEPKMTMHDFRVVWGVSHSNLIFDIVTSFENPTPDEHLAELISEKVQELDPTYRCVITVDHAYVPNIKKQKRGDYK